MRSLVWLVLAAWLAVHSSAAGAEQRTILAVFAHPDDETLIGPLLSAYARKGVRTRPGFPKDRLAKSGDLSGPWSPTERRFLTVRIPYDHKDLSATRAALACHKSQFTVDQVESQTQWTHQALGGQVYLRPWFGEAEAEDLFELATR